MKDILVRDQEQESRDKKTMEDHHVSRKQILFNLI